MVDHRTHRRVAERLDIDVGRPPNIMLQRRRWATIAAGFAPVLVLSVFAARGDKTVYWSAPVSQGHAIFANDCEACHREPFRPLSRLQPGAGSVHSVTDQDCRQCHVESQEDHSPRMDAAAAPACIVCHREHRGPIKLSAVHDQHCISCHAKPTIRATDDSRTTLRVASLEDHPEFAVLREEAEDTTALKFSHSQHLAPLLAPWDGADSPTSNSPRVQLQCVDCHQVAADGQYMRPIIYEEHCGACHPLRFSRKTGPAPLPHGRIEIVRAVLRDRLMIYAQLHPDEVTGQSASQRTRLPNPVQRSRPTEREAWEWVEKQLAELQSDVFRNPVRNGCQQCHVLEEQAVDAERPGLARNSATASSGERSTGFRVRPPNIPRRWLDHGRFRHDKHRQSSCVECHHTIAGDEGVADSNVSPTLTSDNVADILLPSIHACRQCHGESRGTFVEGRTSGACIVCHDYHHQASPTLRFSISELGGVPEDGTVQWKQDQ